MPGPNRNQKIEKPKDAIKTIRKIFSYLAKSKWLFFLVMLFVLISASAQVAGTYFLKPLINDYIIPLIGNKSPDLSGFIRMICIMGGVYVLGALGTFLYNRLMLIISTKTLFKIRTDLFSHLQKLPIRYFDTHTHGEVMSLFTNDTDTLRDMFSQSFVQIFSSCITIVGVFCVMLFLSPLLTIVVVSMVIVMVLVTRALGKRSGSFFVKQQRSMGTLNGYIEEMIEGQKVVKVFCHEEKAKSDFDALNENLFHDARGANTFAGMLMPIMNNLSFLNYAATAMVGGVFAVFYGLDIGTLASFLQYTRSFSHPITQISTQFNAIMLALAGAERIFAVMEESPETDEGYVTLVNAKKDEAGNIIESKDRSGTWAWKHPHHDHSLTYTKLSGAVHFDDVTFGYNADKTVLHDIDLFAKPGQKIALVGSTGAGKTTITNLLNRFYDVPDGKIRYDGININKIKKSALRHSLSMVLQDTHLFTGTIAENIRYGRLNASDAEVIAAAKLANADTFISHLPNGYDTLLVSDGSNLSQGQRQLLAIARAAVANPPVLVLDEATSSIDTRTEALIEKGMN
ncbi:MAG: ABC transporter ATP-binding protein/permease, partial [Treponema sp.]|nr:ABC transporter ATP-binding protein/permease [Treponema sp.]